MDLNTVKEAFDRAAKKQKLSSSKTIEVIDHVTAQIEAALEELQNSSGECSSTDPRDVLSRLRGKLDEIAPINLLDASQKDLAIGLGKCTKMIEKQFNPDIEKAYRRVEWDVNTVNQIIAGHFCRLGLFDIADCFIAEAQVPDISTMRSSFIQMHQILAEIRSRNLQPALEWAATQREYLLQCGSDIEFKLHKLQFLEILRMGSRDEALFYARNHLAPFALSSKSDVQKLMGCLLWVGRLDQSPYAELVARTHWEKMAEDFKRHFCSFLDQSYESPLSVVTEAGVQALPTLLKMAGVISATNQDWQQMKQLPMPVELGEEFQYHSIFVCPVLWEQSNDENPPMMMPCGHVLCRQSVVKLSKSTNRHFKCPYCPTEASVAQCRQLYL